ncbi:MAG: hypothetical protein KGL39_36925 [Patescibacteria group bacterium]|nr:hypothetical protein [Patescibacteria group bacterium]
MPRYNGAASGGTAVAEPPAAPAASAPVTPPAKAGGLKKVSFGKIATKKEETKTAYPVMPDADGKVAEIAARILERTEQFEALKGALETDKAELKFMVAPHYFAVNHGRHEVPSSVAVNSPKGEVLVTFQNRYSQLPDEAALVPVLGDLTGEFFRQSFELKIKGDKLPADKTQELLDEMQNLFAKFGATDALEVKEGIKPVETFHAQRHLQLTPAQNLALEQVVPIVAMIKTKGRK